MKNIRILFLLLISFSSFGQSFNFLGFNTRHEATTAGATFYIDDDVVGTGTSQNNYTGTGWLRIDNAAHYASTLHYSNVTDDAVTFTFVGNRIRWIAPKYINHGIAGVSVDGGAETTVDQYDATGFGWVADPVNTIQYDHTFATNTTHTVTVRVTGTKNASSSGYYVFTDGWIVTSTSTPIDPSPSPTGDWYVGGTGASDGNPGTSTQPFATIQKASTVAVGGDVVKIRAGTYRETITPTNSGTAGNYVTYEAETGATVIVSGFEQTGDTGWSNSGTANTNIYFKTITLPVTGYRTAPAGMYGNGLTANSEITNTFIFANQIVKSGAMIIEASYPKGLNSQDDYFKMVADNNVSNSQWIHRSQTGNTNLGPAGVTDTHMDATPGSGWTTFTTGQLVGAKALIQGWYVSNSSTVTANNGSTGALTWSTDNTRYGGPGAYWRYYRLTNLLIFLTQANEFYYGGGKLYVWQPGGGSPTGIEFKARNWGFDLRGKSYIKIRGISFTGCEAVMGNGSTSFVTLDNIRSTFQNHSLTHSAFLDQGHGMAQFMGIKLAGTNNSVINSEFSYSASMCIWMGPNGLVQNNSFDHIGYDGMWGAPVAWWGMDNCNNISVLNNTATVLGRGFVDNGVATGPNQGQADGLTKNTTGNRIAYNDISYFSSRCQDGGAFYSSQYQNTSGLQIDHNWFHDMPSFKPPDGSSTDGIMAGIYFDQGSGANTGGIQVKVNNNVFWNIGGANISFVGQTDLGNQWNNNAELSDIYSHPYCTGCSYHPAKLATLYYNNTNASGVPGVNGVKSFVTNQTAVTDVFNNNIFLGEYGFSGGTAPGNFGSTNKYRTNVSFAGGSLSTPAAYFQLQSGSVARGIGTSVSTNSDDTAPLDAGAYYYSQTAWTTPGYNAVTYTETP